ncbi:MAG: 4-(cytidine 5'-diphospho)-2-C-methyl-D-erythritol kinase [Bacteroidales bacterium]|nr:4-(cytidine 5'-diphospho)-2-C-methyl-D-erythritol kinase [Bacteroidales bacterium]
MIAFPNAKINLGLNIVSKRSDGFHNLESVFLPLKLADILEVIPKHHNDESSADFFQSGIPIDVDPEKNLVIKAYNLLKTDFDLPPVKIALHKIIPFGSGLGGGSSDATSVVLMLDEIFQLNMTEQIMVSYLEKIGSDCPFFIRNNVSKVQGRGELIRPFSLDLKGVYVVIVVPNISISTQEAFRLIVPKTPKKSLKESLQCLVEEWDTNVINDFEEVLFPIYPELKAIKDRLNNMGAVYASLSGSGSAIYGLFASEIEVHEYFPGMFTWTERFE